MDLLRLSCRNQSVGGVTEGCDWRDQPISKLNLTLLVIKGPSRASGFREMFSKTQVIEEEGVECHPAKGGSHLPGRPTHDECFHEFSFILLHICSPGSSAPSGITPTSEMSLFASAPLKMSQVVCVSVCVAPQPLPGLLVVSLVLCGRYSGQGPGHAFRTPGFLDNETWSQSHNIS